MDIIIKHLFLTVITSHKLQRQRTFQITFALNDVVFIHERKGDFAKFTKQNLCFSFLLVGFIIIWQAAIVTYYVVIFIPELLKRK